MTRRVASLWFPRLGAERALRLRAGGLHPVGGPFALTLRQANTERLVSLAQSAEAEGLTPGMGLSDARALCPGLVTAQADPAAEGRFLRALARWAARYCPWVGLDGADGLVLDITGAAHLVGGEAALADDIRTRLARAGLTVRLGIAESRGAAWALARFREGIAETGELATRLGPLPVAALRLDPASVAGLERVGLQTVAALAALPRGALARRFGAEVLRRLDQAMGHEPEAVQPLAEPPRFSTRLTLPEPVGLEADIAAGLKRLLDALCPRLEAAEKGARSVRLHLRRVDKAAAEIELHLARPMRDAARIAALFERHLGEIDAGYGIDQLRLEAVRVEPLRFAQPGHRNNGPSRDDDRLADLITTLGNRVGLGAITRFLPADSHLPERSFSLVPVAESCKANHTHRPWRQTRPRPIRLFPPEPIAARGPALSATPPDRFRWRAMTLSTARATGPERIAPEWWRQDPGWASGLRDYWRVETREGRRLWLFHTPERPAWFAHGEFP